jgi:lipopolysaccharide transport system ATP-binding protein
VGDADFQRRSLGRMESIGGEGRTVLFVSHNLQGILQLCDRAILLQEGQVAMDGPTADVVALYEQQTIGQSSEVVWADAAEAPGDDIVRLQSVRIVDEDEAMTRVADVRRPVGIEIAFRILNRGKPIVPKIKLYDQHGATAFNAIDVSDRWLEPCEPGEYVVTAWIPGNFLNEGRMSVDADIVSFVGAKFHPHASARQAVSFHVYDPAEGDSARGLFTGQWRGVVRPILDWTTEER